LQSTVGKGAPRIVDVVPNVARFLGMPVEQWWDGEFDCFG
jgi:hypothetical protein